jgi:hypothetical protein
MASEDERIDIEVVLRDRLSRPAENVKRELNDIEKEYYEAAAAAKTYDKASDDAGKTTEKTSRKVRSSGDDFRRTRKEVERTSASVGGFNNNMNNLRKRLARAGSAGSNMFTGFFTSLSYYRVLFTDLGGIIPVVIKGITALGSAAVALVNPLAKVASVSGLIVPAYMSLGQALVTGKLAFSGIGDALKVMNTEGAKAKDIAAAMKGLGPNAKDFVKQLHSLQKPFKSLRKDVQETFLSGLGKTVVNLSNTYLPTLRKGLVATAKQMSGGGKYIAALLQKPEQLRRVNSLMQNNAQITGQFAKFAGQGLVALTKVGTAAAPVLLKQLQRLEPKFEKFVNKIDVNKLQKFFEDSVVSSRKFFTGLKNLAKGIKNILDASSGISKFLTGGLSDKLQKFMEWTSDPTNQKRMQKFFENQKPMLSALGDLLGAFFRVVGQIGGENSNQNAVKFIESLANAMPDLKKIVDGLDTNVTGPLVNLSESLQGLDLGNVFKPIGDILTLMSNVADKLTPFLNSLPEPFKLLYSYMLGLKLIGGFGVLKALFGKTGIGAGGNLLGGILNSGTSGKGMGGYGTAFGGTKVFWSAPMPVTVVGGVGGGVGTGVGGVGGRSGGRFGRVGNFIKGNAGIIGLAGGFLGTAMKQGQDQQSAQYEWGNVLQKAGFGAAVGEQLAGPVGAAVGAAIGAGFGGIQNLINDSQHKADLERRGYKADESGNYVRKEFTQQTQVSDLTSPLGIQSVKDLDKQIAAYQSQIKSLGPDLAGSTTNGPSLYKLLEDAKRQRQEIMDKAFGNMGDSNTANRLSAVGDAMKKLVIPNQTQQRLDAIGAALDRAKYKSDDAKQRLDAIGTAVKNIPPTKQVTVTANTSTAQAQIEAFFARQRKYTVDVSDRLNAVGAAQAAAANARATGGPVWTGETFTVGEKGREVFVGASGNSEVIGASGREQMRFKEPGYVVPNDALDALLSDFPGRGGQNHPDGPSVVYSGDTHVEVHIHGNVDKDVQVEKAVERALRKVEKNRKERR